MRLFDMLKLMLCLGLLAQAPVSLAKNTTPLQANKTGAPTTAGSLPLLGMSMQQVESTFGKPVEKLPSTGKPPITVWRYADFNVYFEYQQVLHSVRFVPFVRPVQVIVE